jgi:threonine aldolase
MIDLRSDTFTKPNEAMLQAMFAAQVGDDVFGEDETVNALEALAADIFGMEAALFCPSGTMTNQIAINCHTQPGDEVITETLSHVYIYEGGGIAKNSGAQVKALKGVQGKLAAEDVADAINPDDVHKAKTSLVCVENTTNRGGGACYDMEELAAIKEVCVANNLNFHLDGARLFNAIVAKHQNPKQYGELFNSISVCLSKGLGAPVGSVLLGSNQFIKQARRVRKVFGGGMRQAGYLAAAGIYALENNIGKLHADHAHAKAIAQGLLEKDFVGKMKPVETNIVIFEILHEKGPAYFCELLKAKNILCLPISKTEARMVTHLDVSEADVQQVVTAIHNLHL